MIPNSIFSHTVVWLISFESKQVLSQVWQCTLVTPTLNWDGMIIASQASLDNRDHPVSNKHLWLLRLTTGAGRRVRACIHCRAAIRTAWNTNEVRADKRRKTLKDVLGLNAPLNDWSWGSGIWWPEYQYEDSWFGVIPVEGAGDSWEWKAGPRSHGRTVPPAARKGAKNQWKWGAHYGLGLPSENSPLPFWGWLTVGSSGKSTGLGSLLSTWDRPFR